MSSLKFGVFIIIWRDLCLVYIEVESKGDRPTVLTDTGEFVLFVYTVGLLHTFTFFCCQD